MHLQFILNFVTTSANLNLAFNYKDVMPHMIHQITRDKLFSAQQLRMAILICLCAMVLSPIVMIVAVASEDTDGLFSHLLDTVLVRYILNTVLLMGLVGVIATAIGVATAWVVCRYQFWGRRTFELLLVLPAAMPAYLIAYAYTDFLEYSGPVQTSLRAIFGWNSAQDYAFFEIRSLGGAALMMGFVLYPYIYLMVRTALRQTSSHFFEIGLMSGKPLFSQIALPLARPAIVAGLVIVLMEVISDFGTVDYFAVETLTLGIFNAWIGLGSIASAARIALFACLLIGALVFLEIVARSKKSYSNQNASTFGVPIVQAKGRAAIACLLICIAPLFFGFILPVLILSYHALRYQPASLYLPVFELIVNSISLSVGAAVMVMLLGVILAVTSRLYHNRFSLILSQSATLGYAFPGTILSIGVLGIAGYLDMFIAWLSVDILLTGSFAILIFGLVVRFLAVGFGALTTAIEKMPPHMMESSQILGHNFFSSVFKIILPQMRTALLVGGLLVFVDSMKELPLTLLLRPFSFETFATITYQYAKDEMIDVAALPALFIVIVGILPVFLANKALGRKQQTQPKIREV